MKIVQIDHNWGDFNPDRAIGIAGVIRDVTLGLLAKGHDVTVIAPERSVFPGVPLICVGKSLKSQGMDIFHKDALAAQQAYARAVLPRLDGFDVVHSHLEHVLLPYLAKILPPVVSTIHGAGFSEKEQAIFRAYPDGVFVALSEGAKKALPYIHFSHVVYNGIQIARINFVNDPQQPASLAWMGRFAPAKGTLDAIAAAKQAGEVITLVGFEEHGQEAYLKEVREQADGASVRLLDRMVGDLKYTFLGNAKALLFPIHWEEPFGLIMIESMACGTPVVAYNRGSVAEIVRDGVTGFIIEPNLTNSSNLSNWIIKKKGVEGLVEAIKRIGEIDRAACRRHVEENFTLEKMVEGYERVYQKVASKGLTLRG